MPLSIAEHESFRFSEGWLQSEDDNLLIKSTNALALLIRKLVVNNGLISAVVEQLQLAPTNTKHAKPWAVTVTHENKLIAIINVSIQPTPFSQSAFTAYTQKTIAAGHNFQKAYREGAYGNTTKPFMEQSLLLTELHQTSTIRPTMISAAV